DSPQELSDRLKEKPLGSPFIVLAIGGSQVLTRAFAFKDLAIADLKPKLQSEAVEFLASPLNEIEFDYQVFRSKISGAYISLKHSTLKEYLTILDKAKVIPVKITTS